MSCLRHVLPRHGLPRSALLVALLGGVISCGPVIIGEAGDDPLDGEPRSYETAAAKQTPTSRAPEWAGVSYARAMSERRYGVPISDKRRAEPRSIYSIELGQLARGERLLLRAEVTLSYCGRKDILGLSGDAADTPCRRTKLRKSPYRYTPRFHAAFFLTGRANSAAGQRVSPWFDRRCTEREHHCALALPQVKYTAPGSASGRFLNLVVAADADGAAARSFDVMEVEQRKGGLHVTRLGPGAPGPLQPRRETSALRTPGWLRMDLPPDEGGTLYRYELFRLKLSGLRPGDVVDADARSRVVLGMTDHGCDPLVAGELILTENGGAKQLSQGLVNGRLTAKNGQNATDHTAHGTRYRKSGAMRVPKGAPATMYIKYVATAKRSCVHPGQDRWRIGAGALSAAVRRSGKPTAQMTPLSVVVP